MNKAIIIGLSLIFISCNYFKPEAKEGAIARVNDDYLYSEDLAGLIPPGTSKEDSSVIVRNYIDQWASRKLLLKAADINLSEERRLEYDALVKEYETDLYTKAYLEDIVARNVDTLVNDSELQAFYNANKENFRTTGMLVRLRFIQMKNDNPKFAAIRSKFFDYRKSDRKFWETYSLQMQSFALNDSIWIDMGQVYPKLPFISPDNREQYIRRGKSIEQKEANSTYLVKIVDVIDRNQTAPYEYVRPTVRDIIINRRKLELINKFEKEITDDAIKDNNYEIYK